MEEKKYLSFFKISTMLPALACIYSDRLVHLLIYETSWSEEWIQKFEVCGESRRLSSLSQVKNQLSEYLRRKRARFDVAIYEHTKNFDLLAVRALEKIPYGQTKSYQELANMIGSPKAARAVGNAMNRNHHVILRACHRIIKQNGQVGFYAGGKQAKAFLLELENAT